jgi:hypothetical protein
LSDCLSCRAPHEPDCNELTQDLPLIRMAAPARRCSKTASAVLVPNPGVWPRVCHR